MTENADLHVGEIADSLANHRLRVTREMLAPFDHHEIECLFRSDVLPNEPLDLARSARRRKVCGSARRKSRLPRDRHDSPPASSPARGAAFARSIASWSRAISLGIGLIGDNRCGTSGTSQSSRCTGPIDDARRRGHADHASVTTVPSSGHAILRTSPRCKRGKRIEGGIRVRAFGAHENASIRIRRRASSRP